MEPNIRALVMLDGLLSKGESKIEGYSYLCRQLYELVRIASTFTLMIVVSRDICT